MSSTTIAVLHAGAVPVFCDVDERTWLMGGAGYSIPTIPVSLYGLHAQSGFSGRAIDDAAQTLRPHNILAEFTSYSFQASKILALGEGGMLVTNDEELAIKAREFSSLGYRMRADQPRIDPDAIKSPTFERHHSLGWNYRLNDLTAEVGRRRLDHADGLIANRRAAASFYRDAIAGCDWLTSQHVPEGWVHDMWSFAVACDTPQRAVALQAKMGELGAEVPYGAWRLTYQEPALRHLAPHCFDCDRPGLCDVIRFGTEPCRRSLCPIAEDLQPRLLQFQTNHIESAEKNAKALKRAIEELSR
jgi:dTDP-4-amino-4,6-dideoxygalactose transaminase